MNRLQAIATLVVVYVVFAFLLNTVGVVILQSAGYFGASKTELSFLEGFKDLSIALTAFLLAAQLPKFGFRRSLLVALALVFVGCVVMPLADAFWATKFLLFSVGVGFGIAKVAVYASVGLITDGKNDHASVLNLIEGFFVLGIMAGTLIFGFFIDPSDPKSDSWLTMYWLVAALSVIGFLMVWFLKLDESKAHQQAPAAPNTSAPNTSGSSASSGKVSEHGHDAPEKSAATAFRDMLGLVARLLIIVFMITQFLSVVIEQGINTWLPTFNKEVLHLNPQMAVIAATLFAASAALGRLVAGLMLKRVDWFPYLMLCIAMMGALVLLTLPLASDVQPDPQMTWASAPIATYIFPLIGFFMGPIYPIVSSVVLSTLPTHEHAGATGLLVIFSALGGTLGSLITGQIFALFDGQTAFYLTLLPITLIALALLLLRRETVRNAG